MATIAFRVYLVGGDRLDVAYDGPEHADTGRVIEHVVSTLAQDTGVVHCRQGGRTVMLFGRGVAAVDVGEQAANQSAAGARDANKVDRP